MSFPSKIFSAALWLVAGFVGAILVVATASSRPVILKSLVAAEPAQAKVGTAGSVEYVSRDEVRKVCQQLRIRDWSQLKSPEVEESEAKAILAALDTGGTEVLLASFHRGLTVELEHGLKFQEANVTNNHPVLTGKIVVAHLKEFADYYQRLDILEIEGDLHKAIVTGQTSELPDLYRKLANARLALAQMEAKSLAK